MTASSLRVQLLITRHHRRGAEVFAQDLARALERAGHTTRVLSLYRDPPDQPLPRRQQDGCLRGDPDHLFERVPGAHPFLLRRLLADVGTFSPDLIQVHGSRAVKYGSLVRRLSRPPRAVVYRNIGSPRAWIGGRLRQQLYRRTIMSAVDGVVGVSQTTLDEVRDVYSLSVPSQAIPRGVDPSQLLARETRDSVRARLGTPKSAPVLLFVGSLSPEKRLDRLLRVARVLASSLAGLNVWIAGDGPLRQALERDIGALGGDLTVRLLGVQTDVASLMAAADLLILTSDTEGMPGVVLEAGGLGLPVVSTAVGGVAECVDDGVTGLLVPREDEAALAALAHELLVDETRRRAIGERARQKVLSSFGIDEVARRYAEFYRLVLDTRRRQ